MGGILTYAPKRAVSFVLRWVGAISAAVTSFEGGAMEESRLAHTLLSPITAASAISNYSRASEATAHFLKAFPAELSITHGPGRSKTNRRRFKDKVWNRVNRIVAMDPKDLDIEIQQLASSQQETRT
jgi:hypothetical protein